MIRVISFIDWYWPGYRAGGVLKAFSNQVSHLEGHFYFYIITRNVDYQHEEPYDNVISNQWNKVAPNAEVFYLSADKINYGTLKQLVNQTDYEVAYIHGVYSPYFSILPIHLVRRKGAKKIVLSAHGMLGRHALAVKSAKKTTFLKLFRALGYYRNVVFHAANQAEADDIRQAMGQNARVVIAEELPMKVNTNAWEPRPKKPGELKICSIARISPEKNTAYAIECLNKCRSGQITYDLYGPVYDKEYWEKCTQLMTHAPENVTINYKGSLQGDKVLDTLKQYHAMFLPTTGENFGHTILESFMAATPVLISQNTPWRNLQQMQCGWDLPLEQQNEFVRVLENLAGMDQSAYDAWSEGALQKAVHFLSDNTIVDQNVKLLMP